MTAITVSIRDLHARTGHFVRKAAEMPIVVTDRGKPVAELKAIEPGKAEVSGDSARGYWESRELVPGYRAARDAGAYDHKPGTMTIDEILDEVKADQL
jgi:prevent-host-death family protein